LGIFLFFGDVLMTWLTITVGSDYFLSPSLYT
jgi:hypothetical protein